MKICQLQEHVTFHVSQPPDSVLGRVVLAARSVHLRHSVPVCRCSTVVCSVVASVGIGNYARDIEILFVCTANICRSPMAAALMAARIRQRGADCAVGSVGLLEGGRPCPPEIIAVMEERGIDLSGHESRQLTPDAVTGADLVLTMEREHLREVVVLAPEAWGRTFTFREAVRRGGEVGPRADGQALEDWLDLIGGERELSHLLGDSRDDEVADPFGQTMSEYEETALSLEVLTSQLADLLWPPRGQLRAPRPAARNVIVGDVASRRGQQPRRLPRFRPAK